MLHTLCGLTSRHDSLSIPEWHRLINDNVDASKLKCPQANFEKRE